MTLAVALRHRLAGLVLDVAFEAPTPGVTALFGPSGAGKSSVVNMVSGLLRADWGRVAVDGSVLADTEAGLFVPPERRRVGLVFQDARLFPHMSVLRNLRYGERRAPRGRVTFEEVVDLLGIGELLARRPRTLSGGERQRVAIGRALLAQPRLLVMDEPLASLDAGRKEEILPYLASFRSRLGVPILYVTHALDEVALLADTLVLLEGGRVRGAGPVTRIAARADLPLALRDDAAALLAGTVEAHDPARGLTRVAVAGQAFLVPLLALAPGRAVRLRVPAREVILARARPEAISLHNVIEGRVRALAPDAARHAVLVEVAVGGEAALLARVTEDAVARLGLAPGAEALALIKSTSIAALAAGAG